MRNWEKKSLGEVCEIVNGSTPLRTNKDFWENGNFPWFTIDDIREQGRIIADTKQKVTKAALSKLRVLPIDTVLLCCTASVGEYAITKIELTTNQQFNGLVVKDRKKLHPEFLMHYCSTLKDQLLGLSGKTTIDFIAISKLKNLEIPLPPLPEQQDIVSILDECFAAIAKAKANAEQNLKNAKELFESYLQGVFENENWEEKSLLEVCEISSKLIDPRKSEFQNLIHVGAGNIETKTGRLSDLKTAKKENLISGKFLFDESMVLYSKIRPYLMKVVNCDFRGLCSADIYPLKPFEKFITKDYLYHLLLTKEFTDYAILGSQRAGMPKVNREHLFAYKLKLPSLKEQQAIVQQLDALQTETQKLEAIYQKKIDDLEELKKSILQKAFVGELKTEKLLEYVSR